MVDAKESAPSADDARRDVDRRLFHGEAPERVVRDYIDLGVPEETAAGYVMDSVRRRQVRVLREKGRSSLLIGGLILGVGLLITVGSLLLSDQSGFFVVSFGAVITGFIGLGRGMSLMAESKTLDQVQP